MSADRRIASAVADYRARADAQAAAAKRVEAAQGTREKARRPGVIRRDPMDDFRNFTFDEIVVGHSETLTSRADPVRMRLASTAVMMLVAHSRRLAARPLV